MHSILIEAHKLSAARVRRRAKRDAFARTTPKKKHTLLSALPIFAVPALWRISHCIYPLVSGARARLQKYIVCQQPLQIGVVRSQAPSIKQTAPSMVIQSPSFPSGFPPPRGIGDSPRIMHDKRGCDTHAYRGALANFKRRALPAEIPAWGEEFGARALCPCLLSVSSALGTQRARRDFQAAASPPVKVWLSGA